MLQLGRKLKQGLFVIMATLTLPSAAQMNAVYPINIPTATSSEYYTKTVNLKETAGSFLAEATMLVYDEILRYQKPNLKICILKVQINFNIVYIDSAKQGPKSY